MEGKGIRELAENKAKNEIIDTSEKEPKDTTDQKSPSDGKHSEMRPVLIKSEEEKKEAKVELQSIDLSKSQFEISVQREVDPTVKVEIEETKKLVEKEPNQNEMTVYMFVNKKSGTHSGEKLLEGGASSMSYGDQGQIHLVDVTDSKGKDSAFAQIKEFQDRSHSFPYIVTAGGDGSLMWVVDEMIAKGIDVLKANFCVLPFGTGNDLAQVTGWGANAVWLLKTDVVKTLGALMTELKYATISSINVWDVEVKCGGDRDILYVGEQNGKRMKVPTGKCTLKRRIINYFSIGGDARIGLGFEKHRSASVFCNKAWYCWEGFKKLCCISTQRINEVVMKIMKTDENKDEDVDLLMVATKDCAKDGEDFLVGNPASILFSNIGSTMGGMANPWRNAKPGLGIESKKPRAPDNFKDENFGDNLIEILTFPSMMSISLETITGGNAKRVAQDSGPFRIVFQSSERRKITTYMNVDGEYYRINNPKEISIQLTSNPLGGKLRIALRNCAQNGI